MAFKKNLPPFVLPTVLNLSSSQKKQEEKSEKYDDIR